MHRCMMFKNCVRCSREDKRKDEMVEEDMVKEIEQN